EKKLKARQKRSKPLLKEFYKWLCAADDNKGILPKSPLRTAINYVNDNWPAFTRYTEQGYLNIDNNASERAIKSVVIGRKNVSVR
ncbi:MAG: transposase, partial [Planctomycetota bacterium]